MFVYETCQHTRFALSNRKKDNGVDYVIYTENAYIELRYLRWAVMPNGQSLVYVNVIQNGRLEHVPDCVSLAIVAD